MSDWGHESEDLFRSARRGLTPSAGDRERVRARIRAKVAAVAVGAAVTGAAAKAAGATSGAAGAGAGAAGIAGAGAGVATKGLSLALIAKIAVPIVLAGASIVAAPHVLPSRRATDPVAVALVAVPRSPTEVAAPVGAPAGQSVPSAVTVAATPSARLPRRADATVHRAPAPVAVATPEAGGTPQAVASAEPAPLRASAANDGEEAALVGAIDAALRSGDSSGALRLAAEHQRRFPQGVLTEEREGARVVARCSSGRGPAASDAAAAFLTAHPRSPMRARILAACGTTETR